ncbi:5,10-methylenetetrahydrofolate reductase [Caulifigura coniformis]|uniref:Methylenetetrahydrofolate reductase n=1 Tax=Caulifigura coniformis TaxID=2527983 RepID=A0A517SH49_9PLAN|nr:methylenetetrahydrofolate reductase [NAD(P)H] [Caulifigura coniformis]QDT55456.1 5,10-methylenetetrahydrofolate reductase [Caulifigura coniformis]
MTVLRQILENKPFCLSIEIFPPKSADADSALWENLERLMPYGPSFVSCTYGAGGSTRNRTVELCREIRTRFNVPATAHFTCVGSTIPELTDWLDVAAEAGIQNFMALRGDPPRGQEGFKPVDGGLSYANELVGLIRKTKPQSGIGVAGYPEKHPEAPDHDVDLSNLKRKVDAGADAVFTQLFFDNASFLRFRDRCRAAGITIPIIPGIMPITEFARIKRITQMCGAAFPEALAARLEAVQDDLDAQFKIGVEFAIEQCRELCREGAQGIHFYALNRSSACEQILDALDQPGAARKPA